MDETPGPTQRTRCPKCGSTAVVPVVYGLPDHELYRAYERGEIELGGCVVTLENFVDSFCKGCHHKWLACGTVDPRVKGECCILSTGFDAMVADRVRHTPTEGYNLVGLDDFEDPGEQLYLIGHFNPREEAETAQQEYIVKGNGDSTYVFGWDDDEDEDG